ncbi:KH domain-containing protein [Caldibacillus lycopersici]|uniref:RNA-binding protein KhpA n=1 Tax=Perspicuibacillus lycopersici TaxID=1325689 RepID=A0AAE3IPB4_9BACI|nr:KH domain-containing protein [Perspicuibacillus lycopersici]MCU9612128.1 KH domain-containing protein [Perspicuibacillus lycopersici]
MIQLIEAIVKPLVDHPDDVNIKVVEDDARITYKLTLNKSDIGKIIGKQGRVAKSIRTIVYAHAQSTENRKVYLDITE